MPQGRDLVATCALRSGGQRPHLERTETRRVSVTSQFITCTERSHCHQQHCAVLLTIQVQQYLVRSGQNWDLKVNRYSASNSLKEATTYSFHKHVFTEPIQYQPLTQYARCTEVEKMQQEKVATLERLQHFRKRVQHFQFLPFSPENNIIQSGSTYTVLHQLLEDLSGGQK